MGFFIDDTESRSSVEGHELERDTTRRLFRSILAASGGVHIWRERHQGRRTSRDDNTEVLRFRIFLFIGMGSSILILSVIYTIIGLLKVMCQN